MCSFDCILSERASSGLNLTTLARAPVILNTDKRLASAKLPLEIRRQLPS